MLQLMQSFMLSQDMHQGFENPRFEPIFIASETEWHYRGQVTPEKDLITIDFECTESSNEPDDCWVVGAARLWADGLKIYHAPRIGMRIVEDVAGLSSSQSDESVNATTEISVDGSWKLSVDSSPWIADHCPTYTLPSLPMMVELDMMAQTAIDQNPGQRVIEN